MLSMVKVTKQEVIFLVLYPVLHCALSFVFLMMAISTGLGPGDAGDPPVTQGQEVASKIGSVLLQVLWLPINLAHKVGIRHLPGSDWLWIALTGVLYGFALLAIYRLLKTTRGERR